jgi:HK97 family phage major capsid protein
MGPLLGLSQKELRRVGLADLILTMHEGEGIPMPGTDRAKERREITDHFRGLSMAVDALAGRDVSPYQTNAYAYSIPGDFFESRAMSTIPGNKGGYLQGSSEIAAYLPDLRNRGLLSRLPAVLRLDGLKANATQVRGDGGITINWQGDEGSTVTVTDPALGSVSLRQRTLIAIVEISYALLRAFGPAGNAYVATLIQRAASEARDKAFIDGAGGAVPLGVLRHPGINSQAGASITWAGVLEMLRLAELYAEDDSLAWVLAPDVAKLLRARERATGNGGFILNDGTIAGVPALVSNSVPAGSMLIAPWSGATVATWGPMSLEVAAGSASNFNKGVVAVRLMIETDSVYGQPTAVTKSASIT